MRRTASAFALLAALAGTAAIAQAPSATNPSAWIGILMDTTPPGEDDASGGSEPPPGVGVTAVMENSPADEGGLREADRIVAVDGVTVSTPAALLERMRAFEPGAWVPLSVRRGRQTVDLRIRLAARPEGNMNRRKGWIGVRAIDLPPALREHFGAPKDAGVLVFDVAASSPAFDAGIRVGDVIFRIGERPVAAAGAVEILATLGGVGNKVEVHLMRSGGEIVTEPRVERTPKDESKAPRGDE